MDISVGQKVQFDPWEGITMYGTKILHNNVTGTVVYVNPKHRMFAAQYGSDKRPLRMSFNFADIGQNVHLCASKRKKK